MSVQNPFASTTPRVTAMSRRDMLKHAGCGFGYLALAGLCASRPRPPPRRGFCRRPPRRDGPAKGGYVSPLAAKAPHFAAKAKRVIFLFMQGGPSHVDTFDYKPSSRPTTASPPSGGQAARLAVQVQPARQERAVDQRAVPQRRQARRRPVPASTACTPTTPPTRRRPSSSTPAPRRSSARRWARGCSTAWARSTRTCPASSRSTRPPGSAGRRTTAAAFLPAAFQGTQASTRGGMPDIANRVLPHPQQRRQLDLLQSMNRDLPSRSGPNPSRSKA